MNFVRFFLIVFVLLVLRQVCTWVFGSFSETTFGDALFSLITLGLTIALTRRMVKGTINFFPAKPVDARTVKFSMLTVLFFFLLKSFLVTYEAIRVDGSATVFDGFPLFGWTSDQKNFFLTVLIIAPILEELFFNGILLRILLAKYSFLTACTFSMVAFMLFHFGRNETDILVTSKLSIAISFMFSSWIVYKYSNIKMGILLHFLWNFLHYLFPIIISLLPVNLSNPLTFYFFSVGIITISAFMLFVNIKKLKSNLNQQEIEV